VSLEWSSSRGPLYTAARRVLPARRWQRGCLRHRCLRRTEGARSRAADPRGRLPDAIGELRALRELQLRGCEVELPESIGGCTSLATLDLVFAKIDELPQSFYTLPALTRLRIQYSPLEKTHKDQIESRMPRVNIFK
jgi:hypothetical protein